MDWKQYEKEIFEEFKIAYPDAKILYNQHTLGKYSKSDRQIDVLIDFESSNEKIRLIIDGKYLNKKVDVKYVESFISMAEDVEADQGILVTNKGFSKAAINRAYYGSNHIELDILNFEELKHFQGFCGIPYAGNNCVFLPAPFGWILDINTKGFPCLAFLYQRGLTSDEAISKNEWIYINFWNRKENNDNLEDLLKIHNDQFFWLDKKIEIIPSIQRAKEKTLIRKVVVDTYPCPEYTGYIEFEDFIFFAVMFSPVELEKKNLRKLRNMMERLSKGNIIDETNKNQ